MRRSLVTICLPVSLLAAACGSTVQSLPAGAAAGGGAAQTDQSLGAPPGSGQSAAAAPLSGTAGGTGQAGSGGVGAGPAAGGGVNSGPAGSGTAGGTPVGGAGSTAAQQQAPGVTATTVTFGYTYCSDCDTSNAAIGGGAGGKQDQKSMILAAVADVNAHGGVGGRKLVPLLYDVKSASSDSIDSQLQSACEYWTKDHKVFAMQGGRQLLWSCARRAGAISLDADGATSRTMHDFPTILDPTKRSLDQLSATTVAGLERQAWSKPTTEWPTGKIGIITWDTPNYHYAVDHGLVPALKAHGLSATDRRYVVAPETLGAVSDSSAAVSSAVLSFQSKGIDHVLIQDGAAGVFSGAGLTLLFLENAESQHYRPRYGFNVNNVPGFSVYPSAQEHGMLAIDSSDFDARMDAGYRTNTARERCFAMMRAQGITISGDIPENAAAQYCDKVWFLQQAGALAHTLTVPGVVAGAESMGTRYQPATVFGSRLSPGRHDGDDLIRNARFDDGCSCMKYTSGAYSAG